VKSTAVRVVLILGVAALVPACGATGGGGTLTPTVGPTPPADVVPLSGNGQVRLTWAASPAAGRYHVSRSANPGGPYVPVPAGQDVAATTFTDTGLQNGATYWYAVRAANTFGESSDSVAVAGVPGFLAVAIAAGYHHSHAILQDGSLWSWGTNTSGALGDGTNRPMSNVAVQVDLAGASALAAGRGHVLALMPDGSVWSWGDNSSGQLGIGSNQPSPSPVPVPGLTNVVQVVAGDYFSVALLGDGTVRAWGQSQGPGPSDPTSPVPVPGLANVIRLAAGREFAFAVRADRTVWGWGANNQGQLGIGSQVPAFVATPGQIPNLNEVASLAAGDGHSLALRTDGTVWGWGRNFSGQLGLGNNTDVFNPVKITALAGITAISASILSSVAVRSDGTVLAWGDNAFGQNGSGPTGTNMNVNVPTPVPGLAGIVAVASGLYHNLAQDSEGNVWAWGLDSEGQLGSGTGAIQNVPVQTSNLTAVTAVAGGFRHSLALRTDGTVWGFGNNTEGELGNAQPTTTSNFRIQVSGLPAPPDVTAVAAGGIAPGVITTQGPFSVFLRSNGTVWTCGTNMAGQLGNNNSGVVKSSTPGQVVTLTGATTATKITAIEAGGAHTLAIAQSGIVWAWGSNGLGQLGNNSTAASSYAPVQVSGLANVVAVSAGSNHSLAVRSDGSVVAWGSNSSNELGNSGAGSLSRVPVPTGITAGAVAVAAGHTKSFVLLGDGTVWAWGTGFLGDAANTPTSATPVQVQDIAGATAIAAGLGFSYARLGSGTIVAWGSNFAGELGNGSLSTTNAPIAVAPLTPAMSVTAGANHGLAILLDGTVRAWGSNAYGQIGIGSHNLSVQPILVTH
jgi:alpha-tubulin suppressor-like RCC1 family protein